MAAEVGWACWRKEQQQQHCLDGRAQAGGVRVACAGLEKKRRRRPSEPEGRKLTKPLLYGRRICPVICLPAEGKKGGAEQGRQAGISSL